MTEEKIKGIVLKLVDYKEADKLASIFSFDQGIITAKFTGVKRDKAKMKAAAQPFAFAEFNIVKSGEHRTIISADIIDNFNLILNDYNKTICGYIVLDILRSILPVEKSEQDVFLLTISALKNIEEKDHYISTIDFILKFMTFEGVGLEFVESEYANLDLTTGNFQPAYSVNTKQIDKKVYKVLKSISQGEDIEIAENVAKQALRLLHNILFIKFDEDILSFQFI